jgi:hypothetical protein
LTDDGDGSPGEEDPQGKERPPQARSHEVLYRLAHDAHGVGGDLFALLGWMHRASGGVGRVSVERGRTAPDKDGRATWRLSIRMATGSSSRIGANARLRVDP